MKVVTTQGGQTAMIQYTREHAPETAQIRDYLQTKGGGSVTTSARCGIFPAVIRIGLLSELRLQPPICIRSVPLSDPHTPRPNPNPHRSLLNRVTIGSLARSFSPVVDSSYLLLQLYITRMRD